VLEWIDIAIIAAYVAYSAASGLAGASRASESLEEYFLAGRSLTGWRAGISMAATQFAADTPLVVTGLIATAGVFSLWRMWIYALAFLLMALVLGTGWRRSGALTDAGLTELRYGGRPAAVLRAAKAVYFGFVFNCTVLAMVLLATTRITEPFLVWNEWLPSLFFDPVVRWVEWAGFPLTAGGAACGLEALCSAGSVCLGQRCIGHAEWVASTNNLLSIGVIVGVTTLYSATGGLRAVVRTDIVQLAIAMTSTLVYAGVVVAEVGGLGELTARIAEIFPPDRSGPAGMTGSELLAFTPGEAHDVGLALIGVIAIQWLCQINADGSGYLAQRTMACRSDDDARRAGVIFAVIQVLLRSLLWLPIGLGLLILFEPVAGLSGAALASEREATFVRGIAELLPPGVKGLMITGMLGALASTLDTHLNWGASYFTHDLYARFFCPHVLKREPGPRTLVWVARAANLGILALALIIMPNLASIQTAWKASLLLGAGVGVVLVLRWLWWRMNAVGELTSLIASMMLAPILLWLVEEDAVRLLLQAGIVTSAAVIAALLGPAEDRRRLESFYRRARPPGFWGPIAGDGAAEDRIRLLHSLAATAAAGLSIFCLLTGLGSWLVGSPAPAFVPWPRVWIGANLALGLAVIPVAWRLARAGRLVSDRISRSGS